MIWWRIDEVPPPPDRDVLLYFPADLYRRLPRGQMYKVGRVAEFPFRKPTLWSLIEMPEVRDAT